MEHQYFVTDDIPEVYERGEELPHVMDPAGETYLRQEGRGLVIGIYEQKAVPWAVDGTPWDFGHELLNDDMDRVAEPLEAAFRRYPVLGRAGIKRVINGPFTFAPDGNPLVGPIPGKPGLWSACAVMAGFCQGGGVGKALAEWMTEGETETDIFAIDVARFGDWTGPDWTRLKVTENYQRRFSICYPNEELPVGRPLRTTPAWGIWEAQRAVWGSGLRHGARQLFRARRAAALRDAELPPLERLRRGGRGMPGRARGGRHQRDPQLRQVPGQRPERRRLAEPDHGEPGARAGAHRADADAEPARPDHRRLHHGAAGAGPGAADRQLLGAGLPHALVRHADGGGRRGRERLDQAARLPDRRAACPRAAGARDGARRLERRDPVPVGHARRRSGIFPVRVQRISYTGDLGYEIYCAAEHQVGLYLALAEAGRDLGLKPFGMRAMMSLRLEKFFGSWLREFKPDYTPAETGLDRFISWKKNDFIGRDAATRERERPPARKLVPLLVEADDADAVAWEPIFDGDEVVGFVTSGGYAHYARQSVAMGLVPRERAEDGTAFTIEILGQRRPAVIATTPLVDADGARMRG